MNTQANETVSHLIAQQLREDILRQRYHAGDRLPSERELAARFGASRGAVREAMSQLEQVGLIHIQPGGARVQAIDSASVSILGSLMSLDDLPAPELVDQFLRVFGALAALSARGAVASASEEQIIELQALLDEVSRNAADFQTMQQSWQKLMEALSSIDNNLVVTLIGNDLRAQFVERMVGLDIQPQMPRKATTELVNNLRQALADRQADAASMAVLTHFDQLRLAVVEVIRSLSSEYTQEAV